jgi:hypothetical protein
MRNTKNNDGKKLFNKEEYLSESQIRGYFSRRATKLKNNLNDDNDAEAVLVAKGIMDVMQAAKDAGISIE